ncbi:hypothetical protein F5Y04DRAFT_279563 [Hypomontagnella monticulosa]|nr:hypothetical protein F5Y04DRAFT_279563 [Hypomontagnella monticulosa]
MSHISGKMDLDVAEQSTTTPDHNARLFCHLTLLTTDSTDFSHVHVCTRKLPSILNEVDYTQNAITPPGVLIRLPQEIRDMIYDFVCCPRSSYFDLTTRRAIQSKRPRRVDFSVPVLAHVCREMREHVMRKYQLVWWAAHHESITDFGFGFFQPNQDTIEILINIRTKYLVVDSGEHAIVKWDDPTREPSLMDLSMRRVPDREPRIIFDRFWGIPVPLDTFRKLIPKQSGWWEKFWERGGRVEVQPLKTVRY